MGTTSALAMLLATTGTFRAMTFNIWVGGTQSQPLSKTVEVIRTSRADIVGIQEPGTNLTRIAADLGWNMGIRSSIVSRYRLLSDFAIHGTRWGGATVELPGGRVILVINTHLTAYPYGPYELRDRRATTYRALVGVERTSGRLGQAEAIKGFLASRPGPALPTVLLGDFNTPSHLDWTPAAKPLHYNFVMRWPVTELFENIGFRDAFRAIHPDPVAKPGYTWSPGYPVPNVAANDKMDRIDLILYRGKGLRPLAAQVVGETGPHTDLAVNPWPSDHRAVVATMSLFP